MSMRATALEGLGKSPALSAANDLTRLQGVLLMNTARSMAAYHESGHALIFALGGYKLREVCIIPTKKYEGVCRWFVGVHKSNFPIEKGSATMTLAHALVAGAIAAMIASCPSWVPASGWRPGVKHGAGQDMADLAEYARRRASSTSKFGDQSNATSSTPDWESLIDLDRIIAETYGMLIKPKYRHALDMLATLLLEHNTMPGAEAEAALRSALTPTPDAARAFLQNVPMACARQMEELGARYDGQRRGWWVHREQWGRAEMIRDMQIQKSAYKKATRRMDTSRIPWPEID